MEVRCNRCGTEYEFDDVLISERGTTVKCTNCGFQFKVFAPNSRNQAPERWVVTTADGAELTFGSLRDLQRGIAERRIGAQDLLSRGSEPPRKLALIAELDPFFTAHDSAPRAPVQRTLHGVAPERVSEPPLPPSAPPTIVDQGPPDANLGGAAPTLRTTPLPEVAPRGSLAATGDEESFFQAPSIEGAESRRRVGPRESVSPERRAAMEHLSSTLPSAPSPARRSLAAPADPGLDLGADDGYEQGGTARSRWIAALVLMGLAALLALTVGRRYLSRGQAPQAAATVETSNPRVGELLAESNRLLDEGDWDGAYERVLKASVLSERDGRVLTALARLEALRADLSWLDLRLIDVEAKDAVATRRLELERKLARTRQAVDAALAASPTDPLALRAQVDFLRMKGDLQAARSRLGPISEGASQPANAYVLAALDLAEDSPVGRTLIDRLRLASSAESGGGRARPLLVYALTRARRIAEAGSELDKISATSPAYSLVPALRAFIARNAQAVPAAESSAAKPPASAAATGNAPASPKGLDFKALLLEAKQAANGGQYGAAEELYYRVLELRPGNPEALAALGDLARKRKDTARAQEMYERALAEDPGFAPAIRGSARLAEDVEARRASEPKPVLPPEATSDRAPDPGPQPEPAPPASSKPELDSGTAPELK